MSPNPEGSTDWATDAARQFAESASGAGLKVPIEAVAEVFRQIETIDIDLAGIERVYNTEETAQFFDKSPQWMYWAMKSRADAGGGLFYYPDGTLIEPERIGRKGIRRFNLKIIQDMAVSLYQKGTVHDEGLKDIIRRIQMARLGRWQPTVVKKPSKRKRKTPHGSGSEGQGTG